MPRRKIASNALLLAILAASSASYADIYINPVVKHAPTASKMPDSVQVERVKDHGAHPRHGSKAESGHKKSQLAPLEVTKVITPAPAAKVAPAPAPAPIATSGKDVPIKLALSKFLPGAEGYYFAYDPAVVDAKVSWKDAIGPVAALDQIKSAGYHVVVSEGHKRVGVSRNASIADQLTQPGVQVWSLEAGVSLKQNLTRWSESSGWKIDWSNTYVDYPIDHGATLVGYFEGKDGVVDRLLQATLKRDHPLTATFYKGNKVVVVRDSGYKPQPAAMPNVDRKI